MSQLLKYYFSATGIPVALYQETELIQEYSLARFSPDLVAHYTKFTIDNEECMTYSISPHNVLYGMVKQNNSSVYILIGPLVGNPCNEATAKEILYDMGQSLSRTTELRSALNIAPHLTLTKFAKQLSLLNYIINKERPPVKAIEQETVFFRTPDLYADEKPEYFVHNSYNMEKKIIACIEHGRPQELSTLLENEYEIEGDMGITANDFLRAIKNIFVTCVSLASRAAVKGGLDYETALNYSDEYLQKMELIIDYDCVMNLCKSMLIDYAMQVYQCQQLKSNCKLVRKTHNYIINHLYKKITLKEIASHTGFNPTYLSRYFKLIIL